MKVFWFSSLLLLLILSTTVMITSATKSNLKKKQSLSNKKKQQQQRQQVNINANDVTVTKSLLSKAKRIDNTPSSVEENRRELNDEFYENYMARMSVVYYQCFNRTKTNEYGKEGFKSMVHFALCPTVNCTDRGTKCMGDTYGEYLIRMDYFIDSYLETKRESLEYNCERLYERCGYNGNNAANDDAMSFCYEQMMDGNNNGADVDFEWQYCKYLEMDENNYYYDENAIGWWNEEARYGECERLEIDDDDGNYNYYYNNQDNQNYQQAQNNGNGNGNRQLDGGGGDAEYFVGAYCGSDHESVYLGIYSDEFCMILAPDGVYDYMTNGRKGPMKYSMEDGESIVKNDCVSCREPDDADNNNNNNAAYYYYNNYNNNDDGNNNQNNYNYYEEYNVGEFCQTLQEFTVSKCEDNVDELQTFYDYQQQANGDDGGGNDGEYNQLRCQCDCMADVLSKENLNQFESTNYRDPNGEYGVLDDWLDAAHLSREQINKIAGLTGLILGAALLVFALTYGYWYCVVRKRQLKEEYLNDPEYNGNDTADYVSYVDAKARKDAIAERERENEARLARIKERMELEEKLQKEKDEREKMSFKAFQEQVNEQEFVANGGGGPPITKKETAVAADDSDARNQASFMKFQQQINNNTSQSSSKTTPLVESSKDKQIT